MSESFFRILGHLAPSQENQLSRTFQACFRGSAAFRLQTLRLFMSVCRLTHAYEPDDWTCDVEVRVSESGRVDIVLRNERANRIPVLRLENKVEAPLTEQQIKKYCSPRGVQVVVITKHSPEVPASRLSKLGVSALRWQDVHRVLKSLRVRNGADRFVAAEFARYLEDLGMAYREDLTPEDFRNCQRVLRAAGAAKNKWLDSGSAFVTADSCMNILRELYKQFIDQYPRARSLTRWGPNYGKYFEDDSRAYHIMDWHVKKGPYLKWNFGCCFVWPEAPDAQVTWEVYWRGTDVERRHGKEYSVSRPISKVLNRHGVLDTDRLRKLLLESAAKWAILK